MNALKGKGDLKKVDSPTLEQLLMLLLQSDDIELKTRIRDPQSIMGLYSVYQGFKLDGCSESAQIVKKWIKYYLRIMVSLDGLGRKEIVKAVANLLDKESISLSFSERLNREVK